MEHHVSSVIRSPKTVMRTIVLLWRCPPLELACLGMYRASFSCGATLCSMEGRLPAKYLGEDNVAKAWKCRVSTPVRAVPLSIDPDIAPFSSIRSACSTINDRKKGCAFDPGALMFRVRFKTILYGYVQL